MKFASVGINQHETPIEIREKVHFKDSQIIKASEEILNSTSIKEMVILNTCNRSEIYFVFQNESEINFIKNYIRKFFKVYIKDDKFISYIGDDAIKHLFKVAIGLDSAIIGEDQILGQIKEAWESAMEIGTSGKYINKIFREAITFSKKIKTETEISKKPLSLSYVGIKLISEKIDLKDKKCIIIGIGKIGKLALLDLISKKANVFVSNHNLNNSLKLKKEFKQINIIEFSNIKEELKDSDLLVCATSSPHVLIKKEMIEDRKKNLYILDFALPRDVDSKVQDKDKVYLYNIDKIELLSKSNLEDRKKILSSYEKKIDEEVLNINKWIKNSKIDPLIEKISQRNKKISSDTLDYIFRKTDLTHGQKKKVETIVNSAIKKVMLEPLKNLKEIKDEKKRDKIIEVLGEIIK